MLKFFCDRCGEECPSTSSSARKFDKLAQTTSGTILGFEVTPTYAGEIGAGSHLCDECVPEMLLLAAKTFTDSGVVAKQELLLTDAKNHNAMKKLLSVSSDMATKREKSAEAQLVEAAQCIADAERQRLEDAEKISGLAAKCNALEIKLGTVTRIKAAAEKQLEVDKRESPEYLESVTRRERIRLGNK